MDVSEAVTHDYREFEPDARVSKLMGAFKETEDSGLIVVGDETEGIVTRKGLLASHHDPNEKARNAMRKDVPQVERTDDIREVARLMVESDLNVLPVYDGDRFDGVVTAKSIAEAVEPFLDALDVSDVYTRDLISIAPDTTFGQAINTLRENGISRVPVIEDDGDAVGMVSFYDLLEFTVRAVDQQQGGDVAGFDAHGGTGSHDNFRSHAGGYGDRAGDETRLLDLPASNVMNSPVAVTDPTTPLDDAVDEMLENDYRSLLVEVPHEGPDGIVTLTDVLRSLTWTPEEGMRLQVFGMQHLTGMSREEVAQLIEQVDDKYEEMDVIEAYVILHKHKEKLRGMPLIQATIRLFTDRGRFAGTGEEYGAEAAIRAAKDRLERNVLDDKSHTIGERRGQRSQEDAEHLLGWWLEA